MPSKNARINVVLEPPLYKSIARLAARDGVSLSLKVRDLVRDALELDEDVALASLAEERDRSFVKSKALTHDQVWR